MQIAEPANTGAQKSGKEEYESKESSSGGRFENPLYRSKRKREDEKEILNMEAPLSLTTLRDKVEGRIEEVEIDID